ncbi:MAG: hypothetical protein GC191_08180 [Azospirillum sp.]|nr:hypothetical protein [Azospirillum sp.]
MIRLNLATSPYWLDLPRGVRVRVHPVDDAIEEAAREVAIERALKDPRRPEPAPAEGEDKPVKIDAVTRGLIKSHLTTATAELAIIEWTGVLPVEGNDPAPVDAAQIGQLMRFPDIAKDFRKQYWRPLDQVIAEGNASAAAPDTGSAAV